MEVLLLSTFKSGWTNTSKAKNNIFAEKFNSGLSKIMLVFFCNFSPQLLESARERVVIIVEFRLSALSFSAQQSFSRIFGRTNMRLGWEVVSDPLPKIFGYLPRNSQKCIYGKLKKDFFRFCLPNFSMVYVRTSKTQNPGLKNLIRH